MTATSPLSPLLAGAQAHAAASADDEVAQRLRRSVIAPLAAACSAGTEPEPAPGLTALALQASELCAQVDLPGEPLLEATAALQALALAAADADPDLCDRLAAAQAPGPPRITVAVNGPYLATGIPRMTDWEGRDFPARPAMALCRCGRSQIKPWCDGSHRDSGFSGEKQAERVADRRDSYVGLAVTIHDNRGICQHSGLCSDRVASAFRTDREPFVAPSAARMDELVRAVRDCPSGALGFSVDGVEQRESTDWHGQRDPVIEVTRDGPYRIRGAVTLTGPGGSELERAQGASHEHCALCRCGQSQNKPFCSGMHWYVDFHDASGPEDASGDPPSVAAWAGGETAILRMTRLFYERHVPTDPLLAELFGTMNADHPQKVAAWLTEVFGGPKAYSTRYGGYERMLAQHCGRQITEEHRVRWISALMAAAREAGLPNDPEFSAVFHAYAEWGSRLAVENSQLASRPPEHMPMPHWEWNTAPGPPGSRVSALDPAGADEDPPPTLPGEGETPRFEPHVRSLFRARDRRSMSFAFDLSSVDDVRTHADAILDRVRAGTMPCDGRWPDPWVGVLQAWIDAGKP